jgi:monofunctional biosynthetic peptidoglycan transglycosylase
MTHIILSTVIWALRSLVAVLLGSVIVVALFRIIPPAITLLMVKRLVTAPFSGKSLLVRHKWVPYERIAPAVFQAVIAGEDGRFLAHEGVDWRAVDHARRVNPGRIRAGRLPLGASTITMQTAKNVFLIDVRLMVRKAAEVYLVYLMEALWGKRRILEVYANMIEWGDGIYGIEAASTAYFSTTAEKLTRDQAARLAAVVPNPRRFSVLQPSRYTLKRTAFIRGRMTGVALPR